MTTDNTKPGRRGFLGLLAAAGPAVKVVFEEKAAATEIAKMVAEDIAPVPVTPRTFTTGMIMVSAIFAEPGQTSSWFTTGESRDDDWEYETDSDEEKE